MNPERLGDLVLARLAVPAARPPTPAAVAKSLLGFVEGVLSSPEWQRVFEETLGRLREGGWVEPERLRLTERGKSRVQRALKLRDMADAKHWALLKTKYLPRLFLEGGNGAAPNCAVAVLAARLEVPVDAKSTPAKVVDAWLVRRLGVEKLTLEELRNALLARELGIPKRRRSQATVADGIATLAEAPNGKPETVLTALTARWLREGDPTATRRSVTERARAAAPKRASPIPSDVLGHFVERVRATANSEDVRRYGEDKVFIGSVWHALELDPEMIELGEREFKRWLVEAHRLGSLVLARADLVAAMDPREVRASETTHLNATYHFIQRGQPA